MSDMYQLVKLVNWLNANAVRLNIAQPVRIAEPEEGDVVKDIKLSWGTIRIAIKPKDDNG